MRFVYFLFFPLTSLLAENSAETARGATPPVPASSIAVNDTVFLRKSAVAAFREAREDAGEASLATLSSAQPQTAAWHLDLAMNLIRTAFSSRAVGDEVAAGKAAQRALKAIAKAERGYATEPARLSTLQDLRGVLLENFLGTTEQAEACYRESARLNPDNPAVRERIERIDHRRASTNIPAQTGSIPSASTP